MSNQKSCAAKPPNQITSQALLNSRIYQRRRGHIGGSWHQNLCLTIPSGWQFCRMVPFFFFKKKVHFDSFFYCFPLNPVITLQLHSDCVFLVS